MLKKFLIPALSCMLMTQASFADETNTRIQLDQAETISGTFTGFHMGQVKMRTDQGQNLELPSMALFWGTDPRVSQAGLKEGDALKVTLPRNQILQILDHKDSDVSLGSYEGVQVIPESTVAEWDSHDTSAANR